MGEEEKERDPPANFREELAVSDIKRQLALGRNRHRAGEHALGELASLGIEQDLGDAAEAIHETGHARVGGARHRPPRLDATEDGIRKVLP